jgi:hypothetical protein
MAISTDTLNRLIAALTLASAGNEVVNQLNNPAVGNLSLTGLLKESAADTITAFAGGGQASATPLTAEMNRITTVATSGDSVKLPVSQAGLTIFVVNHGANPCQVYGAGTDTINDVATATGVSQMQNSTVLYTCITAGSWYTEGLASGFSNGFQTFSSKDAITAFAGGGQASATPLLSMLNRVTTVGTAADSVKLPAAVPGMEITVINAHATNSMNVFPSTGDAINALGANAAFALAATKTATFFSTVAGVWHSQLSA